MAEVLRTRALLDSAFVGLKTKENMAEKMGEAYKGYVQIVLPSRKQIAKIEDMDKTKLQNLRDSLRASKLSIKNRKIT